MEVLIKKYIFFTVNYFPQILFYAHDVISNYENTMKSIHLFSMGLLFQKCKILKKINVTNSTIKNSRSSRIVNIK